MVNTNQEKDFIRGPRLRKDKGQIIKAVNKDFYKFYKEKHKESCVKDNRKIREVLKSFHKNSQLITTENRDGFKLTSLANMFVISCEPTKSILTDKNRLINYKLSGELDKKIKFTNMETDGKMCKIFFSFRIKESKFLYKNAWGFRACRDFKKLVSKAFSKNHTKYMDITSLRRNKKY